MCAPPPDATSPVEIRRARAGDAESVAHVLLEGLGDKYRPAYGRRAADAVAALVRHDIARPCERVLVAEANGLVVGAVHLVLEQQQDAGFVERVAAEIGWPSALRATVVLSAIAHSRLAPGEAYVEELAVSPTARRRGVGGALVDACADEARRGGRSRLTLWVAEGNSGARALYEGRGFHVSRRRRTRLGRVFFGVGRMLYMTRAVDPAG